MVTRNVRCAIRFEERNEFCDRPLFRSRAIRGGEDVIEERGEMRDDGFSCK